MASFLSDMGVTLAELAARPDLADKLAAYHVMPRVRAASGALRGGKGEGSYGVSGDPHYLLRFEVDPKGGSLLVRDPQGYTARVVTADIDAGRSVVHAIDRVLLSGGCLGGRVPG